MGTKITQTTSTGKVQVDCAPQVSLRMMHFISEFTPSKTHTKLFFTENVTAHGK